MPQNGIWSQLRLAVKLQCPVEESYHHIRSQSREITLGERYKGVKFCKKECPVMEGRGRAGRMPAGRRESGPWRL